jgi:hypothetical protein
MGQYTTLRKLHAEAVLISSALAQDHSTHFTDVKFGTNVQAQMNTHLHQHPADKHDPERDLLREICSRA